MDISLKQITYFLQVVQSKSFTMAAASLNISQPALSIAMSQLEKSLGVPLLQRGSHPLHPTEFGEIFHCYAQQVRHDLENARDAISALNSGTIGRLNLCLGPSAAGVEISSVLSSMVADFPAAEIQAFTGVLPAVAERVRSGEFSVYLGTVSPDFDDEMLEISTLAKLPLRVVAGARHPLADGRCVTAAELACYPLLAIGDLDANLPHWRFAFQQAGVAAPDPAIRVRDLTLVRAMLMHTDFFTIMPLSMARPDIDSGSLAVIHPERFDWSLDLKAVTRAGSILPAACRIFLERVIAAFNKRALSDHGSGPH